MEITNIDQINVDSNKTIEKSLETANPFSGWENVKATPQKLIEQFGTDPITEQLMEKFKRITGKELHPWMKRGIFFTHRGFEQWLDAYDNGEPVYLYTGRGPSSEAMHIGHLIPFMFTKYLQDVFNCPLIIQISDDEKEAFKKIDFEILYKMGFENAKEIIALGFNPEKTFIFSNRDYRLECKAYETFVTKMKLKTTCKDLQKIFGLNEESNIAQYDWPLYQSAAGFYQAFPHIFGSRPAHCLVPHAIDQDPYFRLGRDLATKMNLIKTCNIICSFIPPLTGPGKMSASINQGSTVFLTDDLATLKEKVMKYSFSGGGGNGTMEDHKKYGGNTDVDIVYQYLRYFEEDEEKLEKIRIAFTKGEMSCVEIKLILVEKLGAIMQNVRERRSLVSKEVLDEFYKHKKMELPVAKVKKLEEGESKLYGFFKELDIEYRTKYHGIVTTADEASDLKNSVEGTVCKALILKGPKDYVMYVINADTHVDMKKDLPKKMDIKKLSHATKDTFIQILKVPNLCPSLFGICNDTERVITTIFIEDGIPKDKPINFNPARADATTTISYNDMIKFIEHFKYTYKHI